MSFDAAPAALPPSAPAITCIIRLMIVADVKASMAQSAATLEQARGFLFGRQTSFGR
jgi:hypothetical protein